MIEDIREQQGASDGHLLLASHEVVAAQTVDRDANVATRVVDRTIVKNTRGIDEVRM